MPTLRSSPGAVAGRSRAGPRSTPWTPRRCDPRPARWPGAACAHGTDEVAEAVGVAILARRGGRAQRLCRTRRKDVAPMGLRSSPGVVAGRSFRVQNICQSYNRLRSSPGAVAGRSRTPGHRIGVPADVAILARRGGRAQPTSQYLFSPHTAGCDPRPGAVAGRSRVSRQVPGRGIVLRSSPGAVAGRSLGACTTREQMIARLRSSPGAVAGRSSAVPFSGSTSTAKLRSSPGAVAGRSRPAAWSPKRSPWSCDPRPARWPGAAPQRQDRVGRPAGSCDPRPARWPGAAMPSTDPMAATVAELRSSPGAVAGRSQDDLGRRGLKQWELRSSPGAVAGRSL